MAASLPSITPVIPPSFVCKLTKNDLQFGSLNLVIATSIATEGANADHWVTFQVGGASH